MKQIKILAAIMLIFSVPSLFAQFEIGISWEFNEDGNLQGWIPSPNFSDVTVKDSVLTATASGPFPYLESEEFNIAASEYKFIYIRMKVPGANTAKIMWDNDGGEWGFHWFPVQGDTNYHEYQLPVFLNERWTGQIIKIRKIDFNLPLNAQLGIDYIRIVHIGPVPEIASFKPLRTVIKQGHEIPLTAIVQNTGDTEVEMKSCLTLPEGITLLDGNLENTHGTLFREIADTLHWRVKCDYVGDYDLSLLLFSDSDTTEKKLTLSVTDEYWEATEFLLSAWSPPYAWYPAPYEDEIFADYFAANFNIVLWVRPDEDLIAKVENYNKKYFLLITNLVGGDLYLRAPDKVIPPEITPQMLSKLDPLIEQFKDNPNVLGYHICDEPHEQAFENIGKVVSYLREKDPKRLCFVNIWPGTNDTEYKNYIRDLLDITKLDLLSYDRYVFFNDRTDTGIFFNNLRVIRESALNYDIPFCNIIQAIGTNDTRESHLNWRIPNEAEHRWQVYASLAYGVKALIWFHWHLDWGVTGSPESEGIKASIAKTNAEINALGPVLVKLETTGAYHANNVPFGEAALPEDAFIKSVSSNADLVVVFFKDEKKQRLRDADEQKFPGRCNSYYHNELLSERFTSFQHGFDCLGSS